MFYSLSYICAHLDILNVYKKIPFCKLHIDLMDGHFVPRLGVYPEIIDILKEKTGAFIEVHCMITSNNNAWKDVLYSKADIIFAQYESFHSDNHVSKFLKQDSRLNLAFKPLYNFKDISDKVKSFNKKHVLLMNYNPGILNQEGFYDLETLKNTDINITLDGGINFDIAEKFKNNKFMTLVVGTKLLFNENYSKNLNRLKKYGNR